MSGRAPSGTERVAKLAPMLAANASVATMLGAMVMLRVEVIVAAIAVDACAARLVAAMARPTLVGANGSVATEMLATHVAETVAQSRPGHGEWGTTAESLMGETTAVGSLPAASGVKGGGCKRGLGPQVEQGRARFDALRARIRAKELAAAAAVRLAAQPSEPAAPEH